MTIMLVGGGTGGHIMPLLSIASEIKHLSPQTRIVGAIDKNTAFADAITDSTCFDTVCRIDAGKYRRYPNQSMIEKITDIETHSKNVKDSYKTLKGFSQAIRALSSYKPDVIFFKGGYVSVPLGLAARVKKIPYFVHDSDATLSLTGKIIGRWAQLHLFGIAIPANMQNSKRIKHVGIPVASAFDKVTPEQKKQLKQSLNIPVSRQVVLVIGGSQGAKTLNDLIEANIKQLSNQGMLVIHQTGKGRARTAKTDHYWQIEYIDDMATYSGAADLVVSRAGSGVAEFAAQEKPLIVVPAEQLAGGHQMQNARILLENKAARVLYEDDLLKTPGLLSERIINLLKNKKERMILAKNLGNLFPKDARSKIAKLLLDELRR